MKQKINLRKILCFMIVLINLVNVVPAHAFEYGSHNYELDVVDSTNLISDGTENDIQGLYSSSTAYVPVFTDISFDVEWLGHDSRDVKFTEIQITGDNGVSYELVLDKENGVISDELNCSMGVDPTLNYWSIKIQDLPRYPDDNTSTEIEYRVKLRSINGNVFSDDKILEDYGCWIPSDKEIGSGGTFKNTYYTYMHREFFPNTDLFIINRDVDTQELLNGATFNVYTDKECKNPLYPEDYPIHNGGIVRVDLPVFSSTETADFYIRENNTRTDNYIPNEKVYHIQAYLKGDPVTYGEVNDTDYMIDKLQNYKFVLTGEGVEQRDGTYYLITENNKTTSDTNDTGNTNDPIDTNNTSNTNDPIDTNSTNNTNDTVISTNGDEEESKLLNPQTGDNLTIRLIILMCFVLSSIYLCLYLKTNKKLNH